MTWLDDNLPETAQAYAAMRSSLFKDGALDVKTKQLIAVAAANLLRCDLCAKIHAERAMEQGATKEEIAEALGVSSFIAAGTQLLWSDLIPEIFTEEEK